MSNPTPPKQIIHRQPGKHISDTPPDHRCWEIAELRDALAAAHLGRDKAVRERDELRGQLDAKWIKCGERMPPAGDTVIIAFANGDHRGRSCRRQHQTRRDVRRMSDISLDYDPIAPREHTGIIDLLAMKKKPGAKRNHHRLVIDAKREDGTREIRLTDRIAEHRIKYRGRVAHRQRARWMKVEYLFPRCTVDPGEKFGEIKVTMLPESTMTPWAVV